MSRKKDIKSEGPPRKRLKQTTLACFNTRQTIVSAGVTHQPAPKPPSNTVPTSEPPDQVPAFAPPEMVPRTAPPDRNEAADKPTSSHDPGIFPDEPNQPKNRKFPKRQFGNQNRAFNPKWFDQFKFLHYVEGTDSVLCHTCAVTDSQGMLSGDTKKEFAFIKTGFNNWKNAIQRFQVHAASETHKHAVDILLQPGHIDEMLSSVVAAQKVENSRCMIKIIESIVFLGRQGISLRGDGNDHSGNFYQLMLLRAKDDPSLLKWVEKSYDRHMTPQSQNEILKLLALKVLRTIASDISNDGCYSILADEATDVSNTLQLVICIRWVTRSLEIAEEFIGLMPIEKANAETIASAIKDVILRLGLNLDHARGQCYDGCATMSGSRKGVAKIIKDSAPKCLLTHCYCHALNLAVGDTVKNVPLLKETLEDAYELTKLLKYSPKREAALKKIQEELQLHDLDLPVDTAESYSKIKLMCPTRWTVRSRALHSIDKNYKPIQKLLEWAQESQNTGDSDIRARAGGIGKKMDKFHFVYGLHLAMLVLDHSDNLSATIQSPNLCAADAQSACGLVVLALKSLRNDEHAQAFFQKVESLVLKLDITEPEPKLPRRTRPPSRLVDERGSAAYHPQTPEDYYRMQYYAAIDTVISAIEDRFNQPDYKVYVNLEQMLVKAVCIGERWEEHLEVVEKTYGSDFDFNQLKAQLGTFAASYQDLHSDEGAPKLQAVIDHLRSFTEGQRGLLGEVFKLAQYCLVMPASNAVSERAFSTMRRIKTYLRSTMTQNRLNHTMCLNVHTEKLDAVDIKAIFKDFVDSSDRRKKVFARV